jgi:hypothetical protein
VGSMPFGAVRRLIRSCLKAVPNRAYVTLQTCLFDDPWSSDVENSAYFLFQILI